MINKPLCAVCFIEPLPDAFSPSPKGSFKAMVIRNPEVGIKYQQILVKTEQQYLLVLANRYEVIRYGDLLLLQGSIVAPENQGDFDYQGYLLRQRITGVMYYPSISVIGHDKGYRIISVLYNLKNNFAARIAARLPEPHASFAISMTLGDDAGIPKDVKEALADSGMIHIISISGLHMTIITLLVFVAFILIGFGRTSASMATFVFIALYIIMVGSPSPAIRSGVMSILLLGAYLAGRPHRLFYALLLSGLVMLLWDSSLIREASFQLSFGAMIGLSLFYSFFQRWFYKLIPLNPSPLLDIIPASFAANISIVPIVLYHFGRVSLISPVANVLILPLLPATMLFAFFAEAVGLSIFWIPLWLLLEYQLRIISFFGNLL